MKPKISVIMSVFNDEKLVSEAIKSILNQKYTNFEFLICDDGSNDKTYTICKNYSTLDKRIKIIKNTNNLGLTKSLNRLINLSSGEIIARQDSDDISFSNRFTEQIKYFSKNKYKIVTSRALIFDNKKSKPRISYFIPKKFVIQYKNPFIHGTLMIQKDLLLKYGGYNENFYYSQDYKLFWDLIKNGEKIKTIFKPLYLTRNFDNISTIFLQEQKFYANLVRSNDS